MPTLKPSGSHLLHRHLTLFACMYSTACECVYGGAGFAMWINHYIHRWWGSSSAPFLHCVYAIHSNICQVSSVFHMAGVYGCVVVAVIGWECWVVCIATKIRSSCISNLSCAWAIRKKCCLTNSPPYLLKFNSSIIRGLIRQQLQSVILFF